MKPVCLSCARFYSIKQNGVAFEEMREIAPIYLAAHAAADRAQLARSDGTFWLPYKLWLADLLACPSCGHEILVRSDGQSPVAEHYMSDYEDMRAALKPVVRVE